MSSSKDNRHQHEEKCPATDLPVRHKAESTSNESAQLAPTPRKKPFVVRARGIPTQDPDVAEKIIRNIITSRLSSDEKPNKNPIVDIDVVPSCVDEDTSVALVDLYLLPGFLSALKCDPPRSHQEEVPGSSTRGVYITFDSDFYGFTQLYWPESAPVADVIFITGLSGHAYGSWTAKDDPWRMWPRHFLRDDLRCCRTMTYGYNTRLFSSSVGKRLDHTRDFLAKVRQVREQDPERPVLFIAHSFGGILLANALVKDSLVGQRTLLLATYGILFFAVPHRGMNLDDVTAVLGSENEARRNLVEEITKHWLEPIDSFINSLGNDGMADSKIVSFYETAQTRALKQDAEGRFLRNGELLTLLPSASATLGLPKEHVHPVDADHSAIVKFSDRHDTYTHVRQYLKELQNGKFNFIRQRFSKQPDINAVSTMPFSQDTDFVGRESTIAKLRTIFDNHHRAGIYGFAGIGKSQIAIQWAYGVRERDPSVHLFWVYCANRDRFVQSYKEIATGLSIPDHDNPLANVLSLVYRWLKLKEKGKWLLILDNTDDESVLTKSQANETALISYIPDVQHGQVLVTSRSKNAAATVVGKYSNLIPIDQMDVSDCLALVRKKLERDYAVEEVQQLIKTLDYTPLAIVQACAYLNQNIMKPIQIYLTEITSISSNSRLLRHQFHDLRRDPDLPNAVLDAFELSFRHLQDQYPASANLISLMAMLDRQGIPKLFLEKPSEPSALAESDFEEEMSTLINFSLVKVEKDNNSFEIHSLVQTAVTAWLALEKHQLEAWQRAALCRVQEVIPRCNYDSLDLWKNLLSHVSAVLKYEPEETIEGARLLKETSRYYHYSGNYLLAEARIKPAVETQKRLLGPNDSETLKCISVLMYCYIGNKRWKEAEELGIQLQREMESVLGAEHEETIRCMDNLAWILRGRGLLEEAEKLQTQVLETKQRVLGLEHSDTLFAIQSLSSIYYKQKRWNKAEELGIRVFEALKRVLGAEHPDTLHSMHDLAETWEKQGRYKEASELIEECVKLRTAKLGPDHPQTLSSISKAALIYYKQKQWNKAEELYIQELKVRKRVLGVEHPDTLLGMSNVARTWGKQGRYEEALEMIEECIELQTAKLGRDLPDTLHSISVAASIYYKQERWNKAEELYVQVFEAWKRVLGAEHPDTLLGMSNVARTWGKQGRYEEALQLMEEGARLSIKKLGVDHEESKAFVEQLEEWRERRARFR